MRPGSTVAVALLLAAAGCAGLPGAGPGPGGGTPAPSPAATPAPSPPADPSDPATTTPVDVGTRTPASVTGTATRDGPRPDPPVDRTGWEGGRWYDDPIRVDPGDGLNTTELAAVTNRSMARVERIRGLEFARPVPVTVVPPATFRERRGPGSATSRGSDAALRRNVSREAAFLVGENRSAPPSRRPTAPSAGAAAYAPGADRVLLVSANGTDATADGVDEVDLGRALFSTLQARRLDAAENGSGTVTGDRRRARLALVAGDRGYVEHLYERRCRARLDCLRSPSGGGIAGDGDRVGADDDPHLGLVALRLQPYADGPAFVRHLRNRSGWAAVNAAYGDPPASTEQIIHPHRYGRDPPATVQLPDASGDRWAVPAGRDGPVHWSLGEAGVYVMLWYPSVAATRAAGEPRSVVIPYRDLLAAGDDPLDRFDYRANASAGWAGDRLVPYVRRGATSDGTDAAPAPADTGYVWRTVWDTERDAAEFAAAYRALLAHHGARRVPGEPTTRLIADGPFADAFRVTRSGATVTVVNAPTVDALDAIRPPDAGSPNLNATG